MQLTDTEETILKGTLIVVILAFAAFVVSLLISGIIWVFSSTGMHSSGVKIEDKTPAVMINYPDGIGNVAFKCNGTTGVYSGENGVAVLKNDPKCDRHER